MGRMAGPRLLHADWAQLLMFWSLGGLLSYGLLLTLIHILLEPHLVAEAGLRISKNVQLVEQVLTQLPVDKLPEGLVLEPFPEGPPKRSERPTRFDRLLQERLAAHHQLPREIVRDRPPLLDRLGGHWVRLRRGPADRPLWLYQPERLSSSLWYVPLLRVLALLFGVLTGTVLFLKLRVERPLMRLVQTMPDTALAPLPLFPERGITPIRLLSVCINRLLERLNSTAVSRRALLRGLVHDLSGPHARLMLRAEQLEQSLQGEEQTTAKAMASDLQQLSRLTEQLGLLADLDIPAAQRQQTALDDLCGRIAASYPAEKTLLAVPRLLVHVDATGLERCLANLIDNALEYGAPPVVISASRERDWLSIRVDDHGHGLATPTLLTMPPTSRADDRQRSRHRGLGLAIVERFCRDQGGELRLTRAPAGGFRAELRLPHSAAQPLFV